MIRFDDVTMPFGLVINILIYLSSSGVHWLTSHDQKECDLDGYKTRVNKIAPTGNSSSTASIFETLAALPRTP